MFRILRNNRIFLNFIGSYLLILVIISGIGFFTYQEVNKIIRADYIRNAASSLESGQALLEARLNEIDGIITQLVLDNNVKLLNKKRTMNNKDYYDLRIINSKLNSYTLTNRFIDELYIYWDRPGIIVSSKNASDNPRMYYEQMLQYKGMSFETWREKLVDSRSYQTAFSVTADRDGKEVSYLAYCYTYVSEVDSANRIAIIALINKADISGYFNYMEMLEDGSFQLTDAAGTPLLSFGNLEETANHNKASVILDVESPLRGWIYTAAVPASYLAEKAAFFKHSFELATLVMLMLGILAAVIASYRYSQPLKQTVITLNTVFTHGNHNLRGIKGKVSQLVNTNIDMQTRLELQLPLMRASFLDRLLRGSIHRKEDIEAYLSYSGTSLAGDYYIVAVVELPADRHITVQNITDQEIERTNVSELLNDLFSGKLLMHNIDDHRIAILFAYGERDDTNLEQGLSDRLDEALLNVYRELGVQASIGVGNRCSAIMEISRSFQEACKALENKYAAGEGHLIWFNKLNYTYSGCYYPIDHEQRLINYVKNGDDEYAREQLQHLFKVNFQERSLSDGDRHQLYCEFRGTLLKIKEDLLQGQEDLIAVIDERVQAMDRSQNRRGLFDTVADTFDELCERFRTLKSQKQSSPIHKMLEIIHERYTDKGFYLNDLASEFRLSEKYLSHYFKDQTGENFSAYLEKLRLDKALALMADDSLTVGMIADQAGYDRMNTFYRAFKRKFGLSPSTYREQNGKKHS